MEIPSSFSSSTCVSKHNSYQISHKRKKMLSKAIATTWLLSVNTNVTATNAAARNNHNNFSNTYNPLLVGVHRGGHSSSSNNNSNSNAGENTNNNISSSEKKDSPSKKEHQRDEEIHENMEKTKLSFSTISQAEKKARKANTKKKKSSSNSNKGGDSKGKIQQPPPPPPPSPLSSEGKATSTSKPTESSNAATDKETTIQQILKTDDYYQILNLPKPSKSSSYSSTSITKIQITKAYRKQAVLTHPDKNNGNREAYDKVREAYDVLKDDVKRKVYDQYGVEAIKNPDLFATASARAGTSFGGFGSSFGSGGLQEQFFRSMFGSSSYTTSMFGNGNHFYSSGSRRNQQQYQQEAVNENVKYELQVSLEDMYNGKDYELEILLPSSPSSSFASRYSSSSQQTRKKVQVEIPRGMANQQSIRYSGYVDTIATSTPADLIFIVKQKPHAVFTRKGFDLVLEVRLSFKEAICGFEREITHLDGRKITICNPYFRNQGSSGIVSSRKSDNSSGPNMIESGDVHVLKGEGMPKFNWAEKKSSGNGDGTSNVDVDSTSNNQYDDVELNKQYGDLYVQYIVETPSSSGNTRNRKGTQNNVNVSNAAECDGELTSEERKLLGELLDKLYGTKDERSLQGHDHNSGAKKAPQRLKVSSAADFGKASGTPSNLEDDHDPHSLHDDHRDDDMFSRHQHHGAHSFFSKGFGSSFAGSSSGGDNYDDGNVQCQQM